MKLVICVAVLGMLCLTACDKRIREARSHDDRDVVATR